MRRFSLALFLLGCFFSFFFPGDLFAQGKFVELLGWGGGEPSKIVPEAADTGFTDIAVWNHDPAYLKAMIEVGRKYHIGIYATVTLGVGDWKTRFPNVPPPLQEMTTDENKTLARIASDTSKGRHQYQYGGEPIAKGEVLDSEMLCFHDPRVAVLLKEEIKSLLSVPGLKGIAFDYFGYRNYHACYCKKSMELFHQFRKTHPNLSADQALNVFSLETLVAFNNDLADYARSLQPTVKIITHVYPVYLPEPLYGNRLNVDTCGQTAAWFFEPYWSEDKIRRYSQIIFGKEKQYYPRAEGAALIGIYSRPEYSMKSPERIEKELQAILAGGGDRVQVCSMNDVLSNPRYKAVFQKYFKKKPTTTTQAGK